MKIALLGYGKMGKTIERIATDRGHQIFLKAEETPDTDALNGADVAIDFSVPEAAFNNIKTALSAGIPVVSGTTGWLDRFNEIVAYCKEKEGAFLYASNFSIGVNIFFKLNEYLAELMSKVGGYHISVKEIHHIHKLDAPSGTAISLAEQILSKSNRYKNWQLVEGDRPEEALSESDTIPIKAERIGEVPGVHNVMYRSEVDEISIHHSAATRNGFALGAVIAAEWIKDKKGVFGMHDVLEI